MLGMGDIVGLVEAAESAVDEEEAAEQERKLRKEEFDLDDFRKQIVQIKKMGSVQDADGHDPGHRQGVARRQGRREESITSRPSSCR